MPARLRPPGASRPVQIDAAYPGLTDLDWLRQFLQCFIADIGEIVFGHPAIRRLPHFFPQFGPAPWPLQDDGIVNGLLLKRSPDGAFSALPQPNTDRTLNDPSARPQHAPPGYDSGKPLAYRLAAPSKKASGPEAARPIIDTPKPQYCRNLIFLRHLINNLQKLPPICPLPAC